MNKKKNEVAPLLHNYSDKRNVLLEVFVRPQKNGKPFNQHYGALMSWFWTKAFCCKGGSRKQILLSGDTFRLGYRLGRTHY